jgi:aryl-alcohol dehydrogenase-like predicted oxidoreductase
MIPSLQVAGSKVSISRVGFGCARIYGRSEIKASTQLIEAALSAGIRHFDTAPSYGGGLSEAVVGAVLAGVKDVTITTKVGIGRPDRTVTPYSRGALYRRFVRPIISRLPRTKARLLRLIRRRDDGVSTTDPDAQRRYLSREEVLRELDDSLKQLRRNYVDLYLIHEPGQFELTDDLKELLASLKSKGTIGAFGLAWGRVATTGMSFGTVRQGRYSADLPTYGLEGETRIFHGALRHPDYGMDAHGRMRDAGSWMRDVLKAHSDAAIIFSASAPLQIRCVMRNLEWTS